MALNKRPRTLTVRIYQCQGGLIENVAATLVRIAVQIILESQGNIKEYGDHPLSWWTVSASERVGPSVDFSALAS